ncbi:polysaccharide deacetylase family protein [Alteromonas facilis]|uniref:polysaccharide deacetylase family protein n=1 Tax=Alteromonas facilis TaxID=2048004 RepID=UPI000C2912BE|nr:polysaccharide deacetylase family protein [Alteromonas facilis]
MRKPSFPAIFVCCLTLMLSCSTWVYATTSPIDNSRAVILLYHHVSTQTPPSTSISPQQFAQHLNYLNQHHQVISLVDAMTAIRQQQPLPDKSVVITFDDGYRNILENAHPLLMQYKMPYTIFVNPGVVGEQAGHLTWQEMQQMSDDGVLFANHSLRHNHLLTRNEAEDEKQWLTRTVADIEQAEEMLAEQLGYSLRYVAYPFGEYNLALKDALQAKGYIGFGQQSGAVGARSDFGAIPRFPAAGIYANLNTLKTKMSSLPLALIEDAIDPMQSLGASPQVMLKPANQAIKPASITCFYNNSPIEVNRHEKSISFTLPTPLGAGRSRVNCTAPSGLAGRFYWYSQPFFVADKNGLYPD